MANSAPWEGAVCRAMKVGKEEIMGILAAVEYWSKADLNALNKEWQGRVERVAKLAETVPGVTTSIEIPVGSNSYPTLTVNWDEAAFGLTVAQCVEELARRRAAHRGAVHPGQPQPAAAACASPTPISSTSCRSSP